MRKFTGVIVICLLAYGIYYTYKHKNRFIYKFSPQHNEASVNELQLQIDHLKKRLDEERDLTDGLNRKVLLQNDTIYSLRLQLKHFNQKPPQQPVAVKVIKTNQNPLSIVNNKPTNKNEKNLPIARGRDAVELKEFFTDRYDRR